MTAEAVFSKHMIAVIDIGSSAIRLVIAEVGSKTEIKILENLQKPVTFGKDVFNTGRISQPALREGIAILTNFKSVIDSYGVKKMHAVATSAIRDAVNRDAFIDQVFVRTGIDVEAIEEAEENRLELIAVENALGENHDYKKKNCLILEVGSGSTEMIILNQGEVELTRTLSLGSIRLPEQAIAGKTSAAVMQRVLKRSIHDIARSVGREYNLGHIDTFIALGGDMRFAARQIIAEVREDYAVLENKVFLDFVNTFGKMSTEEIVDKYSIPYAEAESLYPALLFYVNFLGETKADKLVVPMKNIRDGLLMELAQMVSGYRRTDVSRQVMSSTKKLGKKYQYDEPHAANTASLAVKLFDLLKQDHGLETRERMLLEVAAHLHEIGLFIGTTGYHKHSSYLVDHAEIFGLRKADKNIVSNVVRYHRRSLPQAAHEPYMSLPRSDRAVVSKLSAILRVATALDKSHQQKIKNFTLQKEEDVYSIWVDEDLGDITMERDSVVKRGNLFPEAFGVKIALKQGVPPKS